MTPGAPLTRSDGGATSRSSAGNRSNDGCCASPIETPATATASASISVLMTYPVLQATTLYTLNSPIGGRRADPRYDSYEQGGNDVV